MIDVAAETGLRVVTLARQEKRNALDRDGLLELEATIENTDEPVIYLTGAGSAFCAGADLDYLDEIDAAAARDVSALGQRVLRTIENAPTVVVAGIDGPAIAGGLELAIACDIRIATSNAVFAAAGVDVGLLGSWGGTYRLPALLGLGPALDLSLTGREVDAGEAQTLGLVSNVRDDPKSVADELAQKPPDSLRWIKQLVRGQGSQREKEQAEQEALADLIHNINL